MINLELKDAGDLFSLILSYSWDIVKNKHWGGKQESKVSKKHNASLVPALSKSTLFYLLSPVNSWVLFLCLDMAFFSFLFSIGSFFFFFGYDCPYWPRDHLSSHFGQSDIGHKPIERGEETPREGDLEVQRASNTGTHLLLLPYEGTFFFFLLLCSRSYPVFLRQNLCSVTSAHIQSSTVAYYRHILAAENNLHNLRLVPKGFFFLVLSLLALLGCCHLTYSLIIGGMIIHCL